MTTRLLLFHWLCVILKQINWALPVSKVYDNWQYVTKSQYSAFCKSLRATAVYGVEPSTTIQTLSETRKAFMDMWKLETNHNSQTSFGGYTSTVDEAPLHYWKM